MLGVKLPIKSIDFSKNKRHNKNNKVYKRNGIETMKVKTVNRLKASTFM